MAQILFSTTPLHGHINASLLLAKTLVEKGHEVVWYTGKRFKETIEAIGARHIAMSFDYDDRKLEEEFPDRRNHAGIEQMKHDMREIFLKPTPTYVREIRSILETFPAEAIVVDPSCWFMLPMIESGELKSRKVVVTGFTALTVSSVDTPPFGPALPVTPGVDERERNIAMNHQFENVIFADVLQYFNQLLSDNGLPQVHVYILDAMTKLCDLYLEYTVPAFEYPRSDLPSTVRFVGPMLDKNAKTPENLPDWWSELNGERPVVHVTQGTLDTGNFNRLVVPTIRALAEEDVLVVVSTGGRPVSAIGADLPANVRVAEYLAYNAFLPLVDIMITNGGYGGVQQALANGVPLIAAGDSEDKPEVNQRIAWSGAGLNLLTGAPSPEQLRDAVRTVLADGKYRIRAKQLQEVFAKYDGPRDAARLLEQLIDNGGL
ncbi:glycosyltransferase [Paenibacillus glycinis]|uniref:Glycosyltransferase n=1 Tax=Paenibacillus glycinis TaxID=2697035 RepID=A0ABW9XS82_9BACL|nr:nucleotide disphospho-sugar-binding domain-containing protein [Paenibacillus glycinis]NBD25517.1 glycosyltransferase [Paenibacillus glycinis]